jgi:porin
MVSMLNFIKLLVLLWLPGSLLARQPANDTTPVLTHEFSYVGEHFNNLAGGIRKGSGYLGMANIRLGLSTSAAGLWRGGEFFINAANTHGAEPSADYLGDIQVASNIEAGNHTYLQELWYRQAWKKGEMTVGLQDLNVDFVNTSNGGLYLNSSFGVLPTVSGNVPAPIFPLTSLGLTSKWFLSSRYTLLAALFDGGATNFESNPHNLKWDLGAGEGLLLFTELQRETRLFGLSGTYKAGIYLHQHLLSEEDDDHDNDADTLFRNNNGMYLTGDQVIWQQAGAERNVSAFVQLGYSPLKHNVNRYYVGLGLNCTGLFSQKGNDMAGIAMAHDGLHGIRGNETTIEFTYRYQVVRLLFLQPDLQYIINPSATTDRLPNCWVMTLRFGVNL